MVIRVLTVEDRGRVEKLAATFGLQLSATLQERFPQSWEEAMGIVLETATVHALTQGEGERIQGERIVFAEAFNQRAGDECELRDLSGLRLHHESGTA